MLPQQNTPLFSPALDQLDLCWNVNYDFRASIMDDLDNLTFSIFVTSGFNSENIYSQV